MSDKIINTMELIKLIPAYKSYIWGGDYFLKHGKNFDTTSISELWELSARENDSSIIASGPNKGKKLADVLTPNDIGPVYNRFNRFPLLIKLIDANDRLSSQVHPSDEYALEHENSLGKTDSNDFLCNWYFILIFFYFDFSEVNTS